MAHVHGWQMIGKGELRPFEQQSRAPAPGHVLVQIAGCGVCHTDLGYLYDGVPTRHPMPLVLGHEIAGVVTDAGEGAQSWRGRRVIVPAVAPCGHCHFCENGRPTACRHARMPGNDDDGGFATHVEVPAEGLCPVDYGQPSSVDAPIGASGLKLWELSVIADAVSTPLQAIRRAGLHANEVAIIVGAGGVGGYAVQIAKVTGAKVFALDVSDEKLARARALGAELVLDARGAPKELKKQIARAAGTTDGWRVFETSGTRAGQELAWSLLTAGGSISIVGYTAEPASVRLSNLMALDATAYGNWGCDPALYPEAFALVASGAVVVRGMVRAEKLDEAPRVLEAIHRGEVRERVVLVP